MMIIGAKAEPTFRNAVEFYRRNHPEGVVWGNLHIALADGNLEDGHIWACQEFCTETQDWLGLFIAESIRDMDMARREQLYESLK